MAGEELDVDSIEDVKIAPAQAHHSPSVFTPALGLSNASPNQH